MDSLYSLEHLQTTFQQLITSLLQVGLILASIILGPFSKWFGRRPGFLVASLLGYAGVTVQILVTAQWPVYIGRLLMGKLPLGLADTRSLKSICTKVFRMVYT